MLPRSQGQGQSWLSALVLSLVCALTSTRDFKLKHRLVLPYLIYIPVE